MLSTPQDRRELVKEGWKSVGKIFILAIVLDVVYQLKVHSRVYPGGNTFHCVCTGVLIKPSGAICNLDCKYCFFLSKEMLYSGSRFAMAEDLLETYLKQLLESHRAPDVDVAWQGGEPTLMGLDFFQRSVALVENLKRPGQKIQYTIQTNGTLLNGE